MNKKILFLVLVLVMVLGSFGFVSAETGNKKVDWLVEEGLVLGDAGGYRLNDPIKRSEVAAMVTRALDAESAAELLKGVPSLFSDMTVNHWANGYVNYSTSMKYVNGYPNGTFGPDRNISYAEMITILVRTTGEEVDTGKVTGDYWATPYIIEAIQLGITDGVTVPNSDYNTAATREKVFEMIYNTVMERLMADREVYKAIVVENERIGNLKEKQVAVVILKEGSNSPDAELRFEKDDKVKLMLSKNMDSEMLLGKIANITIDKDDNLVSVEIDTSYDYYTGPFAAMDFEIMTNTGDLYDVVERAKSSRSEEQLYGVYYNGDKANYLDYVIDNDDLDGTRDGSFVADFARITLKGDVVYFIESYLFDDIAPIVRIKDGGEEIFVIGDYPSADIDAYFLDSIVGFKSGDIIEMNLAEVAKNDVLHVYGDFGIVRTDGKFTGEYKRVRESKDVYYAEIDDELFQIRKTNYKRPVYSFNETLYSTLYDINSSNLLEQLEGEYVVFALDVNDSLQLISGSLEYDEKTILIEKSGTRDIYAIEKDGSEESYRIDNYSVLMKSSTSEGNVADFYRGSIGYLLHDGKIIDRLVRIIEPAKVYADAVLVEKNSRDKFDIDLEDMDIRIAGNKYEYSENTNIFVVNTSGDNVTRINAIRMKDIVGMADEDSDLRAFVITNKDFSDMNVGNKLNVGDSDKIAHTIIFTDFILADDAVDVEVLMLEFSFDPKRDNEITGKNSNGKSADFDVAEFAVLPKMSSGELVELILEDGKVISAKVLLDAKSKEYEITSIKTRDERISLDGKDYWLAEDYMVFGETKVSLGDVVSVVFNPDIDIEVDIIYVKQ